MSDKRKEEISALMDNEASELELRRLLKSMDEDESLLESWSRYQLASSAIKGETGGLQPGADFDISAQVRAAIAVEETFTMPAVEDLSVVVTQETPEQKQSLFKKLLQPIVQTAIAASVAVAVVGSWQLSSVAGSQDASGYVASTPKLVQSQSAGSSSGGFSNTDRFNNNRVEFASFGRSPTVDRAYRPGQPNTSFATVSLPVSSYLQGKGLSGNGLVVRPVIGDIPTKTENAQRMKNNSYPVQRAAEAFGASSAGTISLAKPIPVEVKDQ